jgi:PPOX class probable F420-dependent enzyme
MAVRIEGWARAFLERPQVFGTLATLSADGWPLQAVVWFGLRGDDILVNSAMGRRWPGNLLREPRCSLVVEQGYEWVGVRAVAEALSDPAEAQADIAALARRYHADEPEKAEQLIRDRFERQERVSFLLHPRAVTEHRA